LGWGGSGGRININAKNSETDLQNNLIISINGGKNLSRNEELCSNGASGTLCLNNHSTIKLFINGRFSQTYTPTILSASRIHLIDDIYVINNALCSLNSYHLDGENSVEYKGNHLHIVDSNFEDFMHLGENITLNLSFKFIEIQKS